MASHPTMPRALEGLDEQPRVRDFLASAVDEGRLSHAYLFVGAPGSGKLDAAYALAQCVVCPNGGDGTCDECIRVRHRTHPDVHYLRPGGVSGYLIQQVRDLLDDVSLAPIRATSKVYIVDRAELLRGTAANALLKTIEEPPAGVMFVLVARSADAVLPTIVSRCQQVPFRIVPPATAVRDVAARTGAGAAEARAALAVAATPERAAEFLSSPGRREVRRLVIRTLGELSRDDAWDVLCSARDIVSAVRAPLDGWRKRQEERSEQDSDYLSARALKQLEEATKRELTARERSGMIEALAAAESLLRDVLMRCEGAMEAGSVVNADASDVIERLTDRTSTGGVLRALGAVRHATDDLNHNVSPQLALEVMLLSIKEAL